MAKPRQSPFFRSLVARFPGADRGGLALAFAVAAPVLLVSAGVAVDFASAAMLRTKLQAVADSAAIAGARQFSLANSDEKTVGAIVASFIGGQANDTYGKINQKVKVDSDANEVVIEIEQDWRPIFGQFLDSEITPIRIRSVARLVDSTAKICVLSLEPMAINAVYLRHEATITAKGCGVYVNSLSPLAFMMEKDATMSASLICSAGGSLILRPGAANPEPVSDCPPVADPLAGPAEPSYGACTENNVVIGTGDVTLEPGTYCGGITINGDAKVVFGEGDYIIKDGPFRITEKAEVKGEYAGFYLTGKTSAIDFSGDATIDLVGPRAGTMAGLLFFDDRNSTSLRLHKINAKNANRLEGTIYLPKGILLIDPEGTVAEKSAYTAIIAMSLVLENGPELVLNADYDATDVPVPEGLRGDSAVVLAN